MAKTTNKERLKKMSPYVIGRLESSGISIVKDISKNCFQLSPSEDRERYLFIHTNPLGSEEFIHGNSGLHKLIYSGNLVANIFYKDGENFFRILEKKNRVYNKSMKNYNYNEISRTINLREKEQEVLRLSRNRRLIYYQPENTKDGGILKEGLVTFDFSPIVSSYSHVSHDRKGYDFIMANDGRTLTTRLISGNKINLEGTLKLEPESPGRHLLTLNPSLE